VAELQRPAFAYRRRCSHRSGQTVRSPLANCLIVR
jgi:hypothetical protein